MNCSENVLGPGGAGGHGVSNDPPDSGEASLEAKTGHMASGVEGGDEVGDGGAGDGGVEDGGGGKDGGKGGRRVSTSAIKGTSITMRRAQSLKPLVRSRD